MRAEGGLSYFVLFHVVAAASQPEASPMKISLEWFWNPDHLPFLVAEERGYFSEQGLAVEISEPDDHFEATPALASGQIDAAVTETIHLLQDRFKLGAGQIVGFNRFLHTLGGVMFAKASEHFQPRLEIQRPRDMCQPGEKLRIQYPGAPGDGGIAIVKTMVEFDGGSCDETEIIPVNNGFYHTKALLEDKADVATLIFANFELPEAKGAALDVGFFDLKRYGVPDFCQLILIASHAGLRASPGKFLGLNRALRDAADWIKLNPQDAKAIWYKRFPETDPSAAAMMEDILDRTLFMFPHQQDLSAEYWRHMEAWLVRTKQVENAKPFETLDYWSNELAFEAASGRAAGKSEL